VEKEVEPPNPTPFLPDFQWVYISGKIAKSRCLRAKFLTILKRNLEKGRGYCLQVAGEWLDLLAVRYWQASLTSDPENQGHLNYAGAALGAVRWAKYIRRRGTWPTLKIMAMVKAHPVIAMIMRTLNQSDKAPFIKLASAMLPPTCML
jgi:hypothetical protein